MRALLFVSLGVGIVLVSPAASAADAGLLDGGLLDAALPDASLLDGGEADAATDAATDAAADASAKDASSGSDASGACCPSLPCTCPADGGNDVADGGDNGDTGGGGCSCRTGPTGTGSATPLLLVGLAALVRGLSRKKK